MIYNKFLTDCLSSYFKTSALPSQRAIMVNVTIIPQVKIALKKTMFVTFFSLIQDLLHMLGVFTID